MGRFVSKLALGTVQFGMDYGISNNAGCPSNAVMTSILQRCQDAAVNYLDTAAVYGNAEERLGSMLPTSWKPRIVTKTLPLSNGIAGVEQGVLTSLKKLRRDNVYGLLVHRAEDLLDDQGQEVWDVLQRFQESGYVNKIGVSVYNAEQIDSILQRYPVQIVQMPVSLLDQRLIHDGTAEKLKLEGVEIHVRSIFLQGLMFLDVEDLPPNLTFASSTLSRLHNYLKEQDATPLQAALGYVLSRPELDIIVVGVSSLEEFNDIQLVADSRLPDLDWERFALTDERILNPTHWVSQ